MDCKDCKTEMEETDSYVEKNKNVVVYTCGKCGWIALEYQCITCGHVEVDWEK